MVLALTCKMGLLAITFSDPFTNDCISYYDVGKIKVRDP